MTVSNYYITIGRKANRATLSNRVLNLSQEAEATRDATRDRAGSGS